MYGHQWREMVPEMGGGRVSDANLQLNLGPDVLMPVDPVADEPVDFMADLDELALEVGEVQPARPRQVPPPSGPVVAPAAPSAFHSAGVAFPLLDTEEGPCVLVGPFRCVEDTDIPAIMVYEAVNTAAAVNMPPTLKRGAWLGDMTHDAREDDVQKCFGDGSYHLAVKNAQGGFLKWGRLQVGRSAPRPGRVVAHSPGSTLGGFPGHSPTMQPNDEPPAWAKAIMADMTALKAQRSGPGDDYIDRVIADGESAVKRIEALRGLGQHLTTALGGRPSDPPMNDEPEDQEEGLIDQAAAVLGNALEGASKLKTTLAQFKMLVAHGD